MAWEYYHFLGIAPTADAAEVKRAVFRKRKELAIGKDQKGQEFLNEVSRTLQDVQARTAYDGLQQHGDAMTGMLDDASKAMEAERWADAVRLLKQALLLVPQQPMVMNQLAIALAKLEKYPEAMAIFTELEKLHPNVALYWSNHGSMTLELAEMTPEAATATSVPCPECGADAPLPAPSGLQHLTCGACSHAFRVNAGGRRSPLLLDARFRIRKAIELEPYNASLPLAMARSYEISGQYENAIELVEQAIKADDQVDLQDLDAFFYLSRLYAKNRQSNQIDAVAQRIKAILPPNEPDTQQYVGGFFAHFGWTIAKNQAFTDAIPFLKAALQFIPQDEELHNLLKICTQLTKAADQYKALLKDRQVPDAVKRVTGFFLAQAAGQEIPDEEQRFQALAQGLQNMSVESLLSALQRTRADYPDLYACGDEFFEGVRTQLATAKRKADIRNAPVHDTSPGCSGLDMLRSYGWIILIIVIIRAILAAIGKH
jgi:tetratricopeptide (TPR) repeat protein